MVSQPFLRGTNFSFPVIHLSSEAIPFLALNLLSAVVVAQMSVSVIGTDLVDPSIAISSRDNNQIVIGAGPDKVYYTEDAGNSWNEGKISSTLEMAGNPVVVVDKKGRFYYFHHTKDGSVATQLSKDGGMSWMEQGSFVEDSDSKHYKPGVTLDSKG